MIDTITVNVVTNYADEWFDSTKEADEYIHCMDEGEEILHYDVYKNGVLELIISDGITYQMGE